MSWKVLAVCTIRARIGIKGSTSICSSWIRRPRRWAGSVARAQHDFFRFALVPETSSDERLLTELTSATQEPLRGDILEGTSWKLNCQSSDFFFRICGKSSSKAKHVSCAKHNYDYKHNRKHSYDSLRGINMESKLFVWECVRDPKWILPRKFLEVRKIWSSGIFRTFEI